MLFWEEFMETHLQKWDKSLDINISSKFSKELSICPGNKVNIFMEDKHLSIYPQENTFQNVIDSKNGSGPIPCDQM